MHKHFLPLICIASILATACSTDEKARDNGPSGFILERFPLAYRQDIQQGNIIDQDMVNQLHPGLSKRQVRFIMGTPMLEDTFHPNRWDYVYNMTQGWGDTEQKHVQVYFDSHEVLERVEGDLRSIPNSKPPVRQEVVVSVPNYKDPNRGVIKQVVEQIIDSDDNEPTPDKLKPSDSDTASKSPSS